MQPVHTISLYFSNFHSIIINLTSSFLSHYKESVQFREPPLTPKASGPRPNPKFQDHPLSAVRDSFNIFVATIHIWRPSPPFAKWWRHDVVAGTENMDTVIKKQYINIRETSFEAFTAVMFQVEVSLVVTLCTVVAGYQRSREVPAASSKRMSYRLKISLR